jgi:prephenate dehydrogenase
MEPKRQRITIIGTGCIGTSIGLALRQSKDAGHLEIVGHDREHAHARKGQKMGAFDRAILNLDLALDKARLVIICVPLADLREVLGDVGRLLDSGAGSVITAATPLAVPVSSWADELLPTGNYFVPGDPFLAPNIGGWEPLYGPENAQAGLFQDAVYAIAPQGPEHPGAIHTVSNLVRVLGASPYLMDPVEHDAVSVLTRAVPDLVATALFSSVAEAPGWDEVRRAAGRSFATATTAASGHIASRRMLVQLGRDTLLRGIDGVLNRLTKLQAYLTHGDMDAFEKVLAGVSQARDAWMVEALSREWQNIPEFTEQENLFDRTIRAILGEGIAGKQ